MISRKELSQIEQWCIPYRVKINPWSATLNSGTRYYVNLYSPPCYGRGECKAKLWFEGDNPKLQIDDRYYPIGTQWTHQLQTVQRAIDRFFRENEDILKQRKLNSPNLF